MNRLPLALIAISLFLQLFSLASRADDNLLSLHVATNGNDQQAGDRDAPFASLTRALGELQRARKGGFTGAAQVVVHEGTHWLQNPLQIGPQHTAAEATITITAAPGRRPVISGGRPIGGWQVGDDGIWTVQIPEAAAGKWTFRELFVAGQRRPRARHPNSSYLRIVESAPDKRSGFTVVQGDLPTEMKGGELVFLHDWSISRINIAAIDHQASRLTVEHPIGSKAPHYEIDHFEKQPRYFVENDPALMDAPGEWYLNRRNGVLSYRPMPGETPDNVEVVAPVATALVEVRGSEDRPLKGVHLGGLNFEHCAWPLPHGGYAAGQATGHEQRDGSSQNHHRKMMEAAVSFELAEDCSLTDCRIAHVGQTAVWLGSRTRRCRMQRCLIEDVSGNGLNVGEDTSRSVTGGAWWSRRPEEAAAGHVIQDNVIRTCGRQFFGAVGVWVGLARDVQIVHNEIAEQPYTGISLGWMWNPRPTPAGGHLVSRNDIHHVMQILSDGGGIYTLGRQPGTQLQDNHIHDIPTNAGRAESNGMFLDQGSDEITIAGNLIHGVGRSPLRFHQAIQMLVRNNVLVVANDTVPPLRYNRTDPETVLQENNNIIVADKFDLEEFVTFTKACGPGPRLPLGR